MTEGEELNFLPAPNPQWGGRRPGAGRKPKLITILKREALKHVANDADYMLNLFVEIARNEEFDVKLRMEAGREVMDRVWGKPAQLTRSGEKDEYKSYLERIEKAVRGDSVEGPDPGGATPGEAS